MRRTFESLGFECGKATPCSYVHSKYELYVTVHGDDFSVSRQNKILLWLKAMFEQQWDVRATLLGPESHHAQEVKVPNPSIRWTVSEIEYGGRSEAVACDGLRGRTDALANWRRQREQSERAGHVQSRAGLADEPNEDLKAMQPRSGNVQT